MRSYGQYCPIAKGAELIGDRWTLLIIRELLFGPVRFNEFERGMPGISRSVLANRLRRLERDGIIERAGDGEGYVFTSIGESLRPVVRTIGDWVANSIMEDPRPAELDPELLMLFISRHVNRDELPAGKTVLCFEFADDPRWFWLTMERQDVSVCLEDPCLPVAVKVRARVRELYRVYMGRTTLRAALRDGSVELEGLPADRRRFAEWMKWSSFAPTVQEALQRGVD
jgi:DNA-binding HxlR family transcriptional regulator